MQQDTYAVQQSLDQMTVKHMLMATVQSVKNRF